MTEDSRPSSRFLDREKKDGLTLLAEALEEDMFGKLCQSAGQRDRETAGAPGKKSAKVDAAVDPAREGWFFVCRLEMGKAIVGRGIKPAFCADKEEEEQITGLVVSDVRWIASCRPSLNGG